MFGPCQKHLSNMVIFSCHGEPKIMSCQEFGIHIKAVLLFLGHFSLLF